MAMTADRSPTMFEGRRPGDGMVMIVDRTTEFRRAGRRTAIVRALRVAFPVGAIALLGLYGLSIARTAGLVGSETLPEIAIRKILPEDLAMKNPRYEGFNKDGGSYVFTAKTAQQDLSLPGIVKLNGIVGEVYQADKTRTDITATRGVFDNEKNVLDLFEAINVDSQSGLKERLTRATILTKEDLLTSDEPVQVEFPNGSVRSKRMTLRQKAREVFGDRGVSGVRQTEFLKSDAALSHRHFGVGHKRKEAFDQRLLDIFAQQFGLDAAADQLRAFAEHGDRLLLAFRLREEPLFPDPRLMPE